MMNIDFSEIYYLIFYFIVYSVGGWILESVYKSIGERKIVNSGFMYGPYCPIYGFGTLIMILALRKITQNIVLLFIVSFVVLSFWEYIVAILLEKIYHNTYWDYSKRKFNIKGRVCLLNSMYWGILGVIFMKIIHPFVSKRTVLLPMETIILIDIIFGTIMIIDVIISSIKTTTISSKFEQIKELNEKIKDKLEDMKNDEELIILKKLQLQHHKKKMALYKQLIRVKTVFPTMKSEIINKILNEKIDLKELKEKIKETKIDAQFIKNKVKNVKREK